MNQAVGHCRSVAKHNILPLFRTYYPPVEPSEIAVAANHRQSAMFNLLKQVGLAVGLMYLHNPGMLIYGCFVVVNPKSLVSSYQNINLTALRFHPQVVVACVMPSSDIKSGHMIA